MRHRYLYSLIHLFIIPLVHGIILVKDIVEKFEIILSTRIGVDLLSKNSSLYEETLMRFFFFLPWDIYIELSFGKTFWSFRNSAAWMHFMRHLILMTISLRWQWKDN